MAIIIRSFKKNVPNTITTLDTLCSTITDFKIINNIKSFDNVRASLINLLDGESVYTFTEFKREVIKLFKGYTVTSIKYWLIRGWSADESAEHQSKIQRSRTNLTVDYWINRGKMLEESKRIISEIQTARSNISNNVSNEELRKRSVRCIEYWLAKGYDEKSARNQVRRVNDTTSLKYYTTKYGESVGTGMYKEVSSNKSNMGPKNPQYGKPSPLGSGRGISGTYNGYYFKSLYEYYAIKMFEANKTTFICNDVSVSTFFDKVVIPYQYNGKLRNYIPDFIINDNTIVEVKSKYQLRLEQTKLKIKALRDFISSDATIYNKYLILTEDELDISNSVTIADYHNGSLVIDIGKVDRFVKIFKI